MRPDGWAYYSSAADDEITYRENRLAFHRIWMKPRVMVNVRDVSISSSILGTPYTLYVRILNFLV
jgi:L-lactate dehydrogenase (cytochrome)